MIKIAIQGQEASFHDIAARNFFGDNAKIKPCESFESTFSSLQEGQADFALVAIENSLYGTINKVYDLLLSSELKICGEIYLHIEQCLIGLPDTKLSDIKNIFSHPVALAQCSRYLDNNIPNAHRHEYQDTAASVIKIKELGDQSNVAIASKQAAELYSMEIIAEGIETNKQNYTRFVALQRQDHQYKVDKPSKTSIVLQTPKDTKAGSLFHALGTFAKYGVNLTALHSRPIIGRAWHYMFYIDLEIDYDSDKYKKVFSELNDQGCHIDMLGNYKNGLL
ncbi:prephenate dehydratase [Candidatus Saccharibacteria bacterium]|nr:prephenate dehydratase [Candidatus Saccharibacteria bacterium]